jgi:hypothetical protein
MSTFPRHRDTVTDNPAPTDLTIERVWRDITKCSFAIVSHVTPTGNPRSSGIMYLVVDRHLLVVISPDSWKARQITNGDQLAVTVPVRRGGLLSLVAPIPPATISFHARAKLHPAGSLDIESVSKKLARMIPAERRDLCCVLELEPVGRFLTYGVGVSLMKMRDPVEASGRVPVG